MRAKSVDFWIAVVLLAFCGIAALLTNQVPDGGMGTKFGPSFFPWLMILGISVLSLTLLVKSLIKPNRNSTSVKATSRKVLEKMGLFLLLMLLYATAYVRAGYLVATGVFFILAMLMLGERRPVHVVIVPAGIIAAVYLIFTQIMQVYLP
jgi:hypothetical protein